MDGLTALGLASNIIQVVEMGHQIGKTWYQIHKSAQGASDSNLSLESVSQDLSSLTNTLERSMTACTDDGLRSLAIDCGELARDLYGVLLKLKVRGRNGLLQSIKSTSKTIWKQDEVTSITGRLSQLREQLEFHLVVNLNIQLHNVAQQQIASFKGLGSDVRRVLAVLNEDRVRLRQHDTSLQEQLRSSDVRNMNQHTTTQTLVDRLLQKLDKLQQQTLCDKHEQKDISWRKVRQSLYFPEIHNRKEEVAEAHKNTFEWIFQNSGGNASWDDFVTWLDAGSGIYWINGKAVSFNSNIKAPCASSSSH